MTGDDCIFCTLSKGNSRMLYEDNRCYIIPDRYPSEYGHVLLISKEHYENLLESPDEVVSHMYNTAKKFGLKLKERLKFDGLVVTTNAGTEAGQIIFHFHIHMIPKYRQKVTGFMPHKELDEEKAQELKKILLP